MEDEEPPPYSLDATPSQDSDSGSAGFDPRSLTSYIHSHVKALPGLLRQNRQACDNQQVENDIWTLDHLLPVVESFLADIGAQRKVPSLATLTLVPNSAVPPDAVLSGIDDMLRRNEVGRVSRVAVPPNKKGNRGYKSTLNPCDEVLTSRNREFTDWGGWEEAGPSSTISDGLLWWKDEDFAQRLASYIQPERGHTSKPTIQSPVQIAVERSTPAEKSNKNWGLTWVRKNSPSPANTLSSRTVSLPGTREGESIRPGTIEARNMAGVVRGELDNGKRAQMNTAAEYVAFRRENEFGIWESISGWAIIVTVKIDL